MGILINLPFVFGRFNWDDFMFVSVVEENAQYNRLTGFWSLDLRNSIMYQTIWWPDPDAEGSFLRPIPSFVFHFLFSILGRNSAAALHILSILMHLFVAFTTFLLLGRLSKNHAVSLLAGFIYLFCVHHSFTVGWIATNSDLMAVLFMNLSLYSYIVYREQKRMKMLLISSLLMIPAFLCKETAVITPVAVMLYELVYGKDVSGTEPGRVKLFFSGWKHWGLSFLLLIVYLIVYRIGQFGFVSLMYYDPFKQPLVYVQNLAIGIPIMFLGLLSVLPISFPLFSPDLLFPFVVLGLFLLALFIIVLIPYRKDKTISFCFLLFVIAILPQLSTDASERQLYYPYAAGSYLISFIIFQLKFLKEKFSKDSPNRVKVLGAFFGWYFLIFSIVYSFPMSFVYAKMYVTSLEVPEKYVLQCKAIADEKKTDRLILLSTPGSYFFLYAADIFRYHNRKYNDMYILSSFNGKLWAQKLSDSSLVLKTDGKGWLTNMFVRLLRSNPLITSGKVYKTKQLTATVLKTTPDKSDVLEVRFNFDFRFSESDFIFLYFNGERMGEWDFNTMAPGQWYFITDNADVFKSIM